MIRKTLGQLFSAQEDEQKKETIDEVITEEETTEEEETDTEEETVEEEKADPKAGEKNTVVLALEDYQKLVALASTAKSATAESKKLKAKADKWDSYQAALNGGKPAGDSAGAQVTDEVEGNEEQKELDRLSKKYGSLMADI